MKHARFLPYVAFINSKNAFVDMPKKKFKYCILFFFASATLLALLIDYREK